MKSFNGVPWQNPSVGSTSWTSLFNRAPQKGVHSQGVWDWATRAELAVLVMNGGTSDYFGENNTGAQANADEIAYADAARAAGFDYIVNCTTHPSGAFGAQTQITAASNNVDVASFTGAGVLNVVDTTNINTYGTFAASGTLRVQTDGSKSAVITYTAKTATTFTGCQTTSGSGILATGNMIGKSNGGMMEQCIVGNGLCIANAGNHFDAIGDFSHEPRLTDPANTSYYQDGTHWNGVGAGIGAGIVVPLMQAFIR